MKNSPILFITGSVSNGDSRHATLLSCKICAEMESVCVEAFYLQQALMDQRAFAAAFDTTFAQVRLLATSTPVCASA